jgi:glucoamylase
MPRIAYELVQAAVPTGDLDRVAQYLLPLMLRNVSSDGFAFVDPGDVAPGEGPREPVFSLPGCIIASPSFPADLAAVDQNYVYNWVRDAAIAATEIAEAELPPGAGLLEDYVSFADLCSGNSGGDLSVAVFTIDGRPRQNWSHQHDGPALQGLALLRCRDRLEASAQEVAGRLLRSNLAFVLDNYQRPRFNLWEEVEGQSLFTRAVQLRFLEQVRADPIGGDVAPRIDEAVGWLREALEQHWDPGAGRYVSIREPVNAREGYDPNVDVVLAAVYGAVPVTDTRLLATAAQLRRQWTDPTSPVTYPINAADAQLQLGPLIGRYPGDTYDGDFSDDPQGPLPTDHPWALCTAAFAELYFRLATAVRQGGVPLDALSAAFFDQVGITAVTNPDAAATALREAGDRMLRAIVYHSDHFELSEQFDGRTGYEKSVRNLTWSYAAFLSAVRARRGS